jgi:UDP-N-acetylmuramoyl-L-alanyl-D-glutamate--2,6-diaminopimelate ligase
MNIPVSQITAALSSAALLVETRGVLPERVSGITDDSRRLEQGGLFLAVRGSERDGHDFLEKAQASGAAAVILEDASRTRLPAIVVKKGASRAAAAVAASAAFGWPTRDMRLVGVTGTNGKTTTVHILRHLLDRKDRRSASIGTVGVLVGSEGEPVEDVGLTTPGPVDLQRLMRRLLDDGVSQVAMEVSSHALDQHRVEGLEFESVVFTNLSRDHLDYHRTMEQYFAAKARLLDHLAPHGTLILNLDDPAWRGLSSNRRRVGFSVRVQSAEISVSNIAYTPRGSTWNLRVDGRSHPVRLPLIGDFNISNALGAAGAAYALGLPTETIADRLSTVPQVPGRLEVIHEHPIVLRDYAHTPDALERALTAVRPFARGRLIVVFGAGGDRDKGKRPVMGEIAQRRADYAIVTSDNPRTENPHAILDEIESGMTRGASNRERIEDRRDAIARALAIAGPEDLIVLAGKGHETYQIRGTEKLHFDEKEIVAELAQGSVRSEA